MIQKETVDETKVVKKVIREWKTCDMCGNDIVISKPVFMEAEVRIETGTTYGYTGNKKSVWCDLCLDCFSNHLVPWLESRGVKMQVEETDW